MVSTERDEIGDLTRGFNQMLSRIRQLIQEVYESRIRQKQYEMTRSVRRLTRIFCIIRCR